MFGRTPLPTGSSRAEGSCRMLLDNGAPNPNKDIPRGTTASIYRQAGWEA